MRADCAEPLHKWFPAAAWAGTGKSLSDGHLAADQVATFRYLCAVLMCLPSDVNAAATHCLALHQVNMPAAMRRMLYFVSMLTGTGVAAPQPCQSPLSHACTDLTANSAC
jgi:hypothetical protein